jgi:molybdopterin synthase catalytic subunit
MLALTDAPIDPGDLVRQVSHAGAGAVCTFIGTVRSPNQGHEVLRLEYEAFASMASQELQAIGAHIEEHWPGCRVAAVHRIGRLQPGEVSVAVAVAAAHRAEAFEACRFAIEELKARVPIWKKEIWANGETWVEAQTSGEE